jgi:hypothetical protein
MKSHLVTLFISLQTVFSMAGPQASAQMSPPEVTNNVSSACAKAEQLISGHLSAETTNPLLAKRSFWNVWSTGTRILADCTDESDASHSSICIVSADRKPAPGTFLALLRSRSEDPQSANYLWSEQGPFFGGTPGSTVTSDADHLHAEQAFWDCGPNGSCSGKSETIEFNFKTGEMNYGLATADHNDRPAGMSASAVDVKKLNWHSSQASVYKCRLR